uniref:Methyltransferase domain-containing protein n=1 Tax=Plectus sambesii TaxID=2011161 RepID=A0A914UZD9_9BILA
MAQTQLLFILSALNWSTFQLPVTAILDSERTLWPEYGLESDCRPETTVHVDAFLYDEDEVDELVDQGALSRNYCRMCGSHATAPLTFISHSLGIDQLRFLFTAVLPSGTLRDKVLVDVGSRLGAVLYAAQLFSPGATKLVGIELNPDLCRLQTETATNFGISDKLLVICDDARNRPAELAAADVIV